MKIGSAFPGGKTLKQEDIGDRHVRVYIDRVEVETLGQGDDQETKPVLYFRGKDKGLALNKTNAETITDICGSDETDDWRGKSIILYVDKNVRMGDKRVGGIRVRADQAAKPVPPPPPVDDFQASDDDIPF